VRIVDGALGVAVPLAILFGLVWGDLFAAISLSQIAVRARGRPLTPAGVQKMLGDALDDSSLALAVWDSDRGAYVDVYGTPLELPRTSERGITTITDNGSPVAALIHDPALDTASDVVEGMAATSMMLLENTRLLEELRASRGRIVSAAEQERRRIERDLHDGAQQRLVAIQIRLNLARDLADTEDLAKQIDATQRDAFGALEEIRALAHGIYPAVLRELGLAAALRDLSSSSPVPVEVTDEGIGRSSDEIEAAIYFCAREAIQNAAKHAGHGAEITVTVAHCDHAVRLTVSDSGTGIPPDGGHHGTGIIGMRDRIEAVGGQLQMSFARGQGLSVHATIPDGDK
jgi:signal transduction histidine kinase